MGKFTTPLLGSAVAVILGTAIVALHAIYKQEHPQPAPHTERSIIAPGQPPAAQPNVLTVRNTTCIGRKDYNILSDMLDTQRLMGGINREEADAARAIREAGLRMPSGLSDAEEESAAYRDKAAALEHVLGAVGVCDRIEHK